MTLANDDTENHNQEITCSLADLAPGQRGILSADPDGSDAAKRLRELGFVRGTAVQVLQVAPLGGAVEVEIRGARICLRQSELVALQVRVEAAPA